MMDANLTQVFTPKALLLSGLDAAGKLPFFHFDVATQQQRVAAASLSSPRRRLSMSLR